MIASMAFGFKEAREAVTDAASRLSETASDTKAAVVGVALLAGLACVIGLIALVLAVKARAVVPA